MYISWPETLSTDPNLLMIQAEGSIVVLAHLPEQVMEQDGYRYRLYVDGEDLGVIRTETRIADYLWHLSCLYFWCPQERLIGIYDVSLEKYFYTRIPEHWFSYVAGSFTMYRSNVAIVFTEEECYRTMVFSGKHGLTMDHSLIYIGNSRLRRESPDCYAIGMTGVPFSFAAFAVLSKNRITIYDSDGPYYIYKVTDTEGLVVQSPLWQRANDLRRNLEHMSYQNWSLMARIGKGTLTMKYSFGIPLPVCAVDWVQIHFDGQLVDPATFIEISPIDSHEMKVKALRKLTDVEIRMMEPLHIESRDGTWDSVMDIPFMRQGDEITLQLSPVSPIPGHVLQRVIEKLNIRIRAEIW